MNVSNSEKCALCGSVAELMESHLIPKMVYKKVASYKGARFRTSNNPNEIWQDGEKHKMLCHDCEERFSKLERDFSLNFFNAYTPGDKVNVGVDNFNDYILSVGWRILHDDLYRLNSHEGFHRDAFVQFESDLKGYLYKKFVLENTSVSSDRFTSYLYGFPELGFSELKSQAFDGILCGYSVFDARYPKCLIIVAYAGLIFVTEYNNDRIQFINPEMTFTEQLKLTFDPESVLKSFLYDELIEVLKNYSRQHDELYTPELKAKIQKYIDNHRPKQP